MGCGLSGPTSPLAFAEAVLGAIGPTAASSLNKEQLWSMWNTVVNPLTDTITQVGQYVTLDMSPYCLNRVKWFCDERLWMAVERPKLNPKILMKIHPVTITVKWSEPRGCTGAQLQCHSRSSNVSCCTPTRTRTSPGSAASTESNKQKIFIYKYIKLACFSVNHYHWPLY